MTPEIILGPPGTGKTQTLLGIVDECLEKGIAPEEIGLVSFTRRAAQEAITRAAEKFGLEKERFLHFRTLHSMCFRQLGLSPADVLQGKVLREFADWCGIDLSFKRQFEEGSTFGFTEGDRILHMENLARVRCQPLQSLYDEDPDDLPWSEVDRVSDCLSVYKKHRHLVDYTDMISLYAEGNSRPKIRVLMVDECFLPDTPILVGLSGEWKTIGEIVETGYTGPVVSWSPDKGTVVSKVSGHKKILRNKKMVQIKFRPKSDDRGPRHIVVCTEDHKIHSNGEWISARDLVVGQSVLMENAQLRVGPYQQRHKISAKGKQKLSRLLEGNKRGLGKKYPENYEKFNKVKGGNGRGLSRIELLFQDKLESLGVVCKPHVAISCGVGSRSKGLPSCYKVDFLLEETLTVIELDGQSHFNSVNSLKDRKKEKFLEECDYHVVRFTNIEVMRMSPQDLYDRIYPKCLIEAKVVSLEDYTTNESYVYDIEVDKTHCYFAHGLLVHNCQDLSILQWKVVQRIISGCERVVFAGDDDQCIYRWAGAALEHFVGMPGKVTVLGHSHRVPQTVQGLAQECIGKVTARRVKAWAPRDAEGTVERVGGLEQVDLGGKDILILARNNYILLDQVVPVLRAEGIIYEHHGEPSVNPEILEAITTWEQLRSGNTISEEGKKLIKRYRKGLTPAVGLPIWHEGLDRLPTGEMSYLLAARRRGESLQKKPRVRLSTIHGAKGAQAEHVVLMAEMAPRTAREAEKFAEDEARVWYVGLTRVSEKLSLVQSNGRYGWEM